MPTSDFGRALEGTTPLCRKDHPDSIESTGGSRQIAYYAEALGISYHEAQRRVMLQRVSLEATDEGDKR